MEMSVKKCYQLLKRDEIEDKFNKPFQMERSFF